MATESGYAGKIARVDLSTGAVTSFPTENYSPAFLGGQGLAERIYWDEVPPRVRAFDPENRLVFLTGPCAGVVGLSGARWVVCGKSPATTEEFFTPSNFGGNWGVALKAAGFDGLVVQGKAEKPVYLLVHDGEIKIMEASSLWGKGTLEVRETIKAEHGRSVKVVATGPAGDHMTALATMFADGDASGSGSLGAVMGSKKLKAVAVMGSGRTAVARPDQLEGLLRYVAELRKDAPMTDSGGGNGIRIQHCYGCTSECNRGIYEASDGTKGKFMCQSSGLYQELARKYYGKPSDVPFFATRLCDNYGLNTKTIVAMIPWLRRCYEAGILTEQGTGIPLTKIGSLEFIQALTGRIANRQGFGDVLALGLPRAAEVLGRQAVELLQGSVTRAGERLTYVPQAYITSGILYATPSRQPIQQLHEITRLAVQWVYWHKGINNSNLSSAVFRAIARKFWGSELGADFSTYEGKALAAKMIQDREVVKESLILCDTCWPILYVEHSADHVGDSSLESKIYSAITGRDMTEDELARTGERISNLQRAILAREGHRGRESDILPEAAYTEPLQTERFNPECLLPGKDGQPLSRKGAVYDRDKFQAILGEYYELRGWDRETGLPTKAKLESLGLDYVARDLGKRGLLG